MEAVYLAKSLPIKVKSEIATLIGKSMSNKMVKNAIVVRICIRL